MSNRYCGSALHRKAEMYAMVMSIEEDFICYFNEKLTIQDIPDAVAQKAKKVKEEKSEFLSLLRGLDIQAYIEICNANVLKLNITSKEKDFLNTTLNRIIPIRNAIMHPRPLGYFDYSILKTVFDNICNDLKNLEWVNVRRTQYQIQNEPDSLALPPDNLKKNEKIIENLPAIPDYEETSFVGRHCEIGEIKAKLQKRNVNVLSIIGDGGVGKTATTLNLLYNLLDDPDCNYEVILWTSLKTNELSEDSFKEIGDSIKTTSQMYEKLAEFVGSDSIEDTRKFIIELAQNFNTLFVLDNLETINTSEIKDFIDEFTEYGKVLITSRIGLGEMEHRYKLSGLNDSDVLEYTDRLLELYGYECYFDDEQKKNIVIKELHSNPLAIKWFIRCLYNGQTEKEILSHKEDVINFCMANVYDKLSEESHRVLDILTVAGVELSFPELMYYLEGDISECTKVKYAINELGKCNFIDEEKFRRAGSVAVTDFAQEFLRLNYVGDSNEIIKFKGLERRLTAFGQQLLIMKAKDKLSIKALYYNNKGELVVAMELDKALVLKFQGKVEESAEAIKFAKELLPGYYENYLVSATIYGPTSPLKAAEEYELAIKHSKESEEKVRVYTQYIDFLIRTNDYQKAIEAIEISETFDSNCFEIQMQKAKVFAYIGRYDDAESVLNNIPFATLSSNKKNKIQTRRADICRRRSELVKFWEIKKKLEYLKASYTCLNACEEPDDKVFEYMAKILDSLSYMCTDDEALEFIWEIVDKQYQNMKQTSLYKKFCQQMRTRMQQIQNEEFK
ncbi:MAG: hypothetical protein IJ297_06925, partial [Clostridia bacterium]|nr:hypothetical protein [Clostridia bacterium]